MQIKAIFRVTAKLELTFDGDHFQQEGENLPPSTLITRCTSAIVEDLFISAGDLDFTDIQVIGRTPEQDEEELLRRANADKLLGIIAAYL